MNKCYLALFLILTCTIITPAQTQGKSKSLTMDDVSPVSSATTSSTTTNTPTSKTKKSKSKTSSTSTDPLEDIWQDRMDEAEIKVLTAELRSELTNRSSDTVVELNRQRQFMNELASEGSKKNYSRERSLDVIYKEKYVKLRKEMIEEERINPQSETQLLYADSRKSRKKKLKTPKGQNIPMLDTKAVKTRQTKMDKLEAKLEDLEEEGRHAGVSARIFED
ncbi:MAG: hypothetical protein HY819_16435 [Acidobacteria bacterium]|nr:hypothetical protein [Acidobacteriota bacterium]